MKERSQAAMHSTQVDLKGRSLLWLTTPNNHHVLVGKRISAGGMVGWVLAALNLNRGARIYTCSAYPDVRRVPAYLTIAQSEAASTVRRDREKQIAGIIARRSGALPKHGTTEGKRFFPLSLHLDALRWLAAKCKRRGSARGSRHPERSLGTRATGDRAIRDGGVIHHCNGRAGPDLSPSEDAALRPGKSYPNLGLWGDKLATSPNRTKTKEPGDQNANNPSVNGSSTECAAVWGVVTGFN
ncbi:hypothetical protein Bbelb_140820 [Branchiostoma belcheri]|nr:hypothetical protein Bbelb_140820 [Branchiostoma belcheri]